MIKQFEDFLVHCKICEKFRASNKKDSLLPHEIPDLPYEKVGTDVLTCGNGDLVVVDIFSKWIDIEKL